MGNYINNNTNKVCLYEFWSRIYVDNDSKLKGEKYVTFVDYEP